MKGEIEDLMSKKDYLKRADKKLSKMCEMVYQVRSSLDNVPEYAHHNYEMGKCLALLGKVQTAINEENIYKEEE